MICGSRRDQEEGGGARPTIEPRRDQELGSERWTTFCFSCSSTVALRTLSLRLCSAQLLKQQVVKYANCFALAGSPPDKVRQVGSHSYRVVPGLIGFTFFGLNSHP